ncbi:hypothetical protein NC652_002311 [Populus alba x Populus x berolinensis]|nr:hypothetical protein NC652_002311 [Populus alba x Populus x berolinensis]
MGPGGGCLDGWCPWINGRHWKWREVGDSRVKGSAFWPRSFASQWREPQEAKNTVTAPSKNYS